MSYSSDSAVDPFTFANEHGWIRHEVVASVVDAIEVDTSAGQHDGSKTKTVSLRFPNDISLAAERLKTQTLIDKNTLAHVLIPAGSRIVETTVCVKGAAVLDSKLAFVLGKFCPTVTGVSEKKALATSIAGGSSPITGNLLNSHKVISFKPVLGKEKVGSLNAIYASDAKAQGEKFDDSLDYSCLESCSSVGEPKAFYIAATVVEGTLKASSISVNVTYILPASEF